MKICIAGLTGQTGAGKSSVAGYLRQNGACIIDCDLLAREITLPGSPVLKKLSERFGDDIIRKDGTLDRRLLASRAFADKVGSDALNAITHPAITELARERMIQAENDGFDIAVLDAAVLHASELKNDCDVIICVCAPAEERLERLEKRDKIERAEIMKRMSAQPSEEYYRENSDIIINNGVGDDMKNQCDELVKQLKNIAKEKREG
ncbi:MAG: dephospho-CoA kinase [Clostridia bacterium]|nr:dephospho-CoA kinase [Clostridia bacterium]